MTALLAVLGLACVLLVIVDLLWTTVAAGAGGGPLTGRLGDALWAGMPRGSSPGRHRILQVAGVGITLTVIATWIGLLLLGWFLVFAADPDAVLDATTRQPADAWQRAYFAGFTVFTLGIGDYVPGSAVWQVATVAASATGLTLVTLAITYVLSVITAVTERRQLAAQISALGADPADVLARAWDGAALTGLSEALRSLVSEVSQLAQRHLAFPVLHYFHSPERPTAVAPSIAMLDDLLTVLEHGVAPDQRLPALTTGQLRDAISGLLVRTITSSDGPDTAPELHRSPPRPDLGAISRLGIPVVSRERWEADLAALADRRGQLGELMALDGWEWDAVWRPAAE